MLLCVTDFSLLMPTWVYCLLCECGNAIWFLLCHFSLFCGLFLGAAGYSHEWSSYIMDCFLRLTLLFSFTPHLYELIDRPQAMLGWGRWRVKQGWVGCFFLVFLLNIPGKLFPILSCILPSFLEPSCLYLDRGSVFDLNSEIILTGQRWNTSVLVIC